MIKGNIIIKILGIFLLLFSLIIGLFLFFSKVVFPYKEYAYLIANCSYDLAIIITVLFALKIWRIDVLLFFKPLSFKEVFVCAFLAMLLVFLYPLFKLPSFFNNIIETKILTLEISSYTPQITINEYPQSYGFIRSILIAPFFEEIFFRGIVINKVKEKYSTLIAILFSSILFAVYHMDFEQSISTLLVGLIFGYIYTKNGNLTTLVLIHVLNNLAFFFLKDKQIDADGLNILYYLIYPIGLFLLYIVIQKLTKLTYYKYNS